MGCLVLRKEGIVSFVPFQEGKDPFLDLATFNEHPSKKFGDSHQQSNPVTFESLVSPSKQTLTRSCSSIIVDFVSKCK